MAKSFSNPTFYNSGKPAFGNAFNTDDSGNYTRNKKAKLLYRHNYNGFHFGGVLGSQNNYLLFQRAKTIRNETCASCPNLTSFNTSDLVAGLYTNEALKGVNVIDLSHNDPCNNYPYSQTIIEPSNITGSTSKPFYWNYNIDPCGSLFGNAPCGYDNYEDYRVISKPVVTTAASLKDCCVPVCLNELEEKLVCATVCNNNNNNFIVTGSPDISFKNGYTVLTFTTSGSFQFQNVNKSIGYIVVGGGGAGGGGDSNGNGGGGGGGGGGVSYITTNSQPVSLDITYTITIGIGGSGASNATGGAGSSSSISGIFFSSASGGGGGGSGNYGSKGTVGVAGGGGGNGGDGYNDTPPTAPTYGSNGSTVTTNYGVSYLLSSGGGGGGSNRAGQPGSLSGGGAGGVPSGSGGENGVSATYYGCGGGASSGDGQVTRAGEPRTGGNGAPGVVIVWFST
jgi:hypothetical protein